MPKSLPWHQQKVYVIRAINSDGEPVQIVVRASNSASAKATVKRKGFMVKDIYPTYGNTPFDYQGN